MTRLFEPYKLSPLQRLFLVPYYSASSIINPHNGANIASLGDATSFLALRRLSESFKKTESGRKLLRTKPLITTETLNVDKLRNSGRNTLGYQYIQYMDNHGFSADERSTVKFQLDEDKAYLICRYRQVHDFWHTLSGLPPTILGELVLKVFEFELTGLPICFLSATAGQLRLTRDELRIFYTIGLPWAISMGKRCSQSDMTNPKFDVLTYHYEENLGKDVDLVRKELGMEEAPLLV